MTATTVGARPYYPALDGLRTVAVVAVILFHAGTGVRGGWLGVDLFMALSGWLVTSIFFERIARGGGVRYRSYIAGRYRRLMPAVALMLAGVSVLAALDLVVLRRDAVLGALTWTSNWVQLAGPSGYWAAVQAPSPLEHLWSLAVEEQFYVVWPLVVLAVLRWRRDRPAESRIRAIRGAAIVGAVLSLVLGVAGYAAGWSLDALYLNTLVRAFPFLVGAAVAGRTQVSTRRVVNHGIGWLSIAVLAWHALMLTGSRSMFAGRLQLVELACVGVVIYIAGMRNGALVTRPMRAVGRWSYGIYLFHWPAVVVLRGHTELRGWPLALATCAISVPIAAASYQWVENPLRRAPWLRPRRRVPGIVFIAPAFTLIAGCAMVASTPVAALPASPTVVTLPTRAVLPPARPTIGVAAIPTLGRSIAPAIGGAAIPSPIVPPIPTVTVVGDSTAMVLSDAVNEWASANPEQLIAGRAAGPGCGLSVATDGRLHDFWGYDDVREKIDLSACTAGVWEPLAAQLADPTRRPDVLVVQVTPWDVTDIAFPDGRVESILTPDGLTMIRDAYVTLVEQATSVGTRVVFVEPAVGNPGWHDRDISDPRRWQALRDLHASFAASNPLVSTIDQGAWLTANGFDGPAGRVDGIHVNPDVERRFVAEALVPFLNTQR